MKKALLALMLACSGPAFALVAPLEQSIREIHSILSARELRQYLRPNEVIRTISHIENGYIIMTNKRFVEVLVEYEEPEQGWVGPRKYRLLFRSSREPDFPEDAY